MNITLNKNSVPKDKSALVPGGVRLGAPALTSRGFVESDFVKVVGLIDEAVSIAQDVKNQTKKLKDFNDFLDHDPAIRTRREALRAKVTEFASAFPMPGFDEH